MYRVLLLLLLLLPNTARATERCTWGQTLPASSPTPAAFIAALLAEQLDNLYEEEDQGLDARCDEDDYLHGVVLCTGACVAAGHDGVQHDLRAILEQEVDKVDAPAEVTEFVLVFAEEHDPEEPERRAQQTEDEDKGAQYMVRVIVKLQVGRIKGETERDPIQGPVEELDEEHPHCPRFGQFPRWSADAQ
eukprot:scaffold20367_cov61-Phaeocystis_antarctica.AAC.2